MPFRALRHRNYRLYFFGQLVSLTGTWMQTPALMWLAFELTRQSRWPAWIAASQFLPTFFLGFWGGTLADRWPKRTLLFWTQTCLMLLPLLLVEVALQGVRSPWPYLAISTLTGLVLAVDFPTRLSFVMDMVGREDLTNAVGLNALMFNTARLIGPVLGGVAMHYLGPPLCFWANSVSFLALLLALMHMQIALPAAPPIEETSLLRRPGGFDHLLGQPSLLAVIFLAGTMGALGWPFLSLLPALADRVLAAPQTGYALLLSGTGLGALSAAFTVAAFGTPRRNGSFMAFGIGTTCTGLVALALADGLLLACGCCVLIGFGMVLFFSIGQAVLQLGAGETNRGQVMGIWAMVVSGAQPLGNLVAGPAADQFGEQRVLAALGVTLGTVALLTGCMLAVRSSGFER